MSKPNRRPCFRWCGWIVAALAGLCHPVRSELPEWVVNPPPGHLYDYVVGMGHSASSGEAATQRAIVNGLRRIVESKGIRVGPTSFRYERADSSILIYSNLEYQTEAMDLEEYQVVEEYRRDVPGMGWEGMVLIRYPGAIVQRRPGTLLPLVQSVVAPGWGHRSVGQGRAGARFLAVSGLVLAGAVGTMLAANQFHGQAMKARTAESIGYYNTRSRLFGNFALGLSITYGLCGIYSVIDLAESKYIKVYL